MWKRFPEMRRAWWTSAVGSSDIPTDPDPVDKLSLPDKIYKRLRPLWGCRTVVASHSVGDADNVTKIHDPRERGQEARIDGPSQFSPANIHVGECAELDSHS